MILAVEFEFEVDVFPFGTKNAFLWTLPKAFIVLINTLSFLFFFEIVGCA